MRPKSISLELRDLFRKNPDLLEFIKALKYEFQDWQRPPDQQIIDDVDLQKMLKVSKRTTANYRAQGLVDYYRFGGKIFYKLSDILNAMEKGKIPGIASQVRIGRTI